MLGALTEQAVGGEHLWYSCAFAAGGSAGLLGLVTGGVARMSAVQRWGGRLGQLLGASRVGQWAKAAAGELAVAARRGRVTGVPQGLTGAQFRELSARVRAKSLELGYGDDPFSLPVDVTRALSFAVEAVRRSLESPAATAPQAPEDVRYLELLPDAGS